MHHRSSLHVPFAALTLAAIAAFMAAPGAARAAQVSCETFNECTVGTCLENGTCEASPGNNGHDCETSDPCTTGKCMNGECQGTPVDDGTACETFNPCMEENGTCVAGDCVGDTFPDGSACREDVLGPCFTGTCTTIFTVTFCTPESKCGEWTNACEFNCNFETGACETSSTHICDTQCSTATCQPGEEPFSHTCTNTVNKPNSTPCEDGSTCTVGDKCETGTCVSGEVTGGGQECGNNVVEAPEECDDGDASFSTGQACDADCNLVPCGKPTNSTGTLPKASDALFTLKVAVNSATCALSVCDVNNNGSITASDALIILKKAVSSPVTLNCPTGGGGGV